MRPPRRLVVPLAVVLILGTLAGASTAASSVALVVPWGFSPNHDGRHDEATIVVTTGAPATVSVRITTRRGAIVRTLAEDEPAEGAVTFVWRGRDDAGQRVRDARYRVVVTVLGVDGAVTRTAPIVLDTTPPTFAWRDVAPEPLRTTGPVRFTFVGRDRFSARIAVGFTVRDVEDRRVERARLGTRSTGEITVAWDARAPGSRPVLPGLYRVEIDTRDALGNARTSRQRPFRSHRAIPSSVLRRVDGAGRRIALTFDDCGSSEAWRKILDALASSRAEATFFCVGTVLATSGTLPRRTVGLGNAVGAHGWGHDSVVGVSESVIRSRVRDDQAAWWRRARTTPAPFFRPPGGELGATTLAGVGAEGFRWTVLWDVDPADWTGISSDTIRRRVLSSVRPGSIVVLHVTSATAEALPGILQGLRAKELEAVSLPALLRAARSR